jgi:hypothetical protein
MGFGLVIGFIVLLHVVTTGNSRAFANSHTLLLTTAPTKSSEFVFTSCCLVTAPNNTASSASVFSSSCPHWLATPSQLLMAATPSHSQLLSHDCPLTGWLAYLVHLYTLGTDPVENTALASSGPTGLYCDVTCSLLRRSVYHAVA